MNDLVSIIVPIYNVEKYLDKCINSIIAQTYNKLEIILVDDGSPDKCAKICDEYAEKESRIVVIHKENGGLSSARNAGLKIAKGDYISFVDSDDYIYKGMVEHMLQASVQNAADIVICDYKTVYEDEKVNYENLEQCNTGKITDIGQNEAQVAYFNDDKKRKSLVVVWNKLYERRLFENIRFPEGRIHEDEAVTYRLLYKAKKIMYIKNGYYFYLERKGSIMASTFNKKRFQLFDAYIERLKFYEENNEKELYKKVIFLYMHMLCQYAEWSSKSETKNKDEINQYYHLLLNNLNLNNIEINLKEKVELWLFNYFNVYKKLWKLNKGK